MTLGHLCFSVLVLSYMSKVNNQSHNGPAIMGSPSQSNSRQRSGPASVPRTVLEWVKQYFKLRRYFKEQENHPSSVPKRADARSCPQFGMILLLV